MTVVSGVTFDEKTTKVIEELRKAFDVTSNAQVIERALILAKLAADKADKDHNVLIGNLNNLEKINIAS